MNQELETRWPERFQWKFTPDPSSARAAIIWAPFVLTVSPSGLIWGHFGRRLWGPQPRRVRMEARRVGIQMRRVGLETRRVGTQ